MATKIWVGTDSGNEGDWDTAANWQDVEGGSTTVPATGDDVIIQGEQDITGNLDSAPTDLASLVIGQDYTGKIGIHSDGIDEPLQVGATLVEIGGYDGFGSLNLLCGVTLCAPTGY